MHNMGAGIANLKHLGYNSWFKVDLDDLSLLGHELARVVSVHKESYQISKGEGAVFAQLAGKLLYACESPLMLPTTGDWVLASFYDDDSRAIVHDIVTRKSLIKRKTASKRIEFQLIAANVDAAFIIQSLDHNFNPRRLERYLVMINESGILPVILLSKSDLLSTAQIAHHMDVIRQVITDVQLIPFSNKSRVNLDKIKSLFRPTKTYCLLGSSGVGKTTLLNRIEPGADFATRPVRGKDSKGRHTTTRRQLTQLSNGAMIIDTPGMRELGNMSVDSGLDQTFSEITALSQQCKFNDCTHVHELGCAILAAVSDGRLSDKRVNNYLRMQKESRYNEMSYLEKRQKDKRFGKLVKSIMQQKKRA